MFEKFHDMLTNETSADVLIDSKLAIFSGVRTFPARVKCATLAWHTMQAALKNEMMTVATE